MTQRVGRQRSQCEAGSKPVQGKVEVFPSSLILDIVLTSSSLIVGLAAMYGLVVLADAEVVDGQRIKLTLAILAPVVTMVSYVSPLPVVVDAMNQMNAQSLPTQMFYLQAICNVLSISYGIQIMNFAVLVTNMFGLGFQVLFLCGDHFVRTGNTKWFSFSLKASIVLNIGLYVMAKMSPLSILGHSIILFNLIMFASPLAKIPRILRTRNASALPFTMTFLGLCNNGVWSLYALFIKDIVVLLPSILGYLISGFQVLVILWCQGSLPFNLEFFLVFCQNGHDRNAIGAAQKSRTEDVQVYESEMHMLNL